MVRDGQCQARLVEDQETRVRVHSGHDTPHLVHHEVVGRSGKIPDCLTSFESRLGSYLMRLMGYSVG